MADHPYPNPTIVEVPEEDFRSFFLSEDGWNATCYLLIGPTKEQYQAWGLRTFGDTPQNWLGHAFHTAIETSSGFRHSVIVLMDKKWEWRRDQMGTLVHECVHAASSILWNKGLSHTPETDECWAYLIDSLFERFTWALKNPKEAQAAFWQTLPGKKHPDRPKLTPLAKKRRKK